MKLIPTILCGGAGSRLWPVSREFHPKPFIQLADGKSLLQKAFERGADLSNVSEIITVTNQSFFSEIESEIRKINHREHKISFILEPFGRNTAAAIATAALFAEKHHGEESMLLILAADHLITDQNAFQDAVLAAIDLASQEKLVAFGIQPDEPNTGYGYIEAKGSQVLQFVEKPSLDVAKTYLATQRFLWNSGMYLFTVKTILRSLQHHCPEILDAVKKCLHDSAEVNDKAISRVTLNTNRFALVPENSIDYAVMEKSSDVAVVPCQIGWTDVGSWEVLANLVQPDENGNRLSGDTCLYDVNDCFIQSDDRLIAAVGVENLLIVDTPDALLVADKNRSQDVKQIYTQLKKREHDAHKLHRTVHRPWGTYTILEEGPRFKIKRIVVKPGASLSLQMHHHRSEHWIVVSGMAKVTNGDDSFFVHINESTYIPAGHKHRLENPGVLDLIMIEVQSGEYLGEDDIVRYQDNYGRVPEPA